MGGAREDVSVEVIPHSKAVVTLFYSASPRPTRPVFYDIPPWKFTTGHGMILVVRL